MQLDPQSVGTWLETLHGTSPGLIHVCASGNWTGFCGDIEQSLAYVATMDRAGKSGIYVRTTTLRNKPTFGTRGSDSDALALPGLWGDIDIRGPGHKHDPAKNQGRDLPPNEEVARQIVATSGLPEPTLWVHSGGGLYPWWLLTEPHVIDGDLGYVQDLSQRWQYAIQVSALRLGWHYGAGVKDLSRVLRIPGTVNRKVPDTPTMCRIVEGGGGQRYTLTDLYQMAQAIDLTVAPESTPITPPVPAVGPGTITPTRTLPGHHVRAGDAIENEPWDSELLLGGAGWVKHHEDRHGVYWTRPGKDPRDGYSATTGRDPLRDRLWVFSDSAGFPVGQPLTKFWVYTDLHHGGDFSSARKALLALGFGTPDPEPVLPPDPWIFDEAPQGPVLAPVTWKRFEWDDLGNGERFAVRYQHRVKFTDRQQWIQWNGRHWVEGADIAVENLAGRLVRELVKLEAEFYVAEPGEDEKDSERDRFIKWASKQGNESRIKAMISRGRTEGLLQVRTNDLDGHPMLFNCSNGVLDLRSGDLSRHDQELLITKISPVQFVPDAKCPQWDQFLSEVVPDLELRLFLQRLIGYSLTGETGEQVLFCHVGTGANGKSTFKRVLNKLFGNYFFTMAPTVLLADRMSRAGDDGKLASIRGHRLLEASESGRGRRWDEEIVKRLTGDDTITARHMYQEDITFFPVGKVHLFTNELPHVSITDSMWRRLRVFPWEVSIPEDERDKHLARKLEGELPGILNWALVGCLDWQRIGLAPPPKAVARVVAYREDEDVLGEFIETHLVKDRGHFEPSGNVYQAYRNWSERMGLKPMSAPALSRCLGDRGLKVRKLHRGRGFEGIRVVNSGPNWIAGTGTWGSDGEGD